MLIDMHSHILPKADHGSDSLECSRGQLEKATAAGIDIIVATPHFYMDRQSLDSVLDIREQAYNSICDQANTPRIIKAAEVAICPGLEKLDGLAELCIENTNYILLEMPDGVWNDWIYDTIFEIEAKRNLRPVIAHIDRYNKAAIKQLLAMNVLIQINADSLLSVFRRKELRGLFLDKKAHVLGSDSHGEGKEYIAFSKAVKILGDITETVMDNAQQIINNIEIL